MLGQFKPSNISCFHRNWTSLALSQTCGSLKRSSGRESWSAVMTCLSTCRAVLQRMKRVQQLMYVSIKKNKKTTDIVEGVNYNPHSSWHRNHTSMNVHVFASTKTCFQHNLRTDTSYGPLGWPPSKLVLLAWGMAVTMAASLGLPPWISTRTRLVSCCHSPRSLSL